MGTISVGPWKLHKFGLVGGGWVPSDGGMFVLRLSLQHSALGQVHLWAGSSTVRLYSPIKEIARGWALEGDL